MLQEQNPIDDTELEKFVDWLVDQRANGAATGSCEDLRATFIAGQMIASPEVRRVAIRHIKEAGQ